MGLEDAAWSNPPGNTPRSYPQLAMYSCIHGNGQPYLTSAGVLDTAVIASQARWDYVTLDVSSQSLVRPVVTALRARNPRIRIFGFLLGHFYWVNPVPDTLPGGNFPWHYWQAVRNTKGVLYDTLGKVSTWYQANVNLASRRTMEALADTVIAEAVKPGLFDGLFIDVNCISIAAGSPIDYRRAGFSSLAAFDSSWRENHARFVDRIRLAAPPGFYLMGNCGPSAERTHWNGWMRENWPDQNGGSWESNMVSTRSGDPGYLADDSLYVQPSLCWISEQPTLSAMRGWATAADSQRVRFGLGSATLAGGVFTYVRTPTDALRGYTPLWFPEYDGAGRGKGWLGQPLGRAESVGGCWRRDFERGTVLVNPTERPVTVPLGARFVTLNGVPLETATVPPRDGLFLAR